ncbi:MAG: hypothetical protein P8L18_14110 [Verrucomicrobiota bacterium]|jgi:hypothetical protein|nr:hypothetical protein [Verrucomicrobiota bacterium]
MKTLLAIGLFQRRTRVLTQLTTTVAGTFSTWIVCQHYQIRKRARSNGRYLPPSTYRFRATKDTSHHHGVRISPDNAGLRDGMS